MSDVDQRFAPPNALVEDVKVEGEAELASRGIRLLSAIVDALIAGGVGMALTFVPAYKALIVEPMAADMMGLHLSAVVAGYVIFLLLQGWLLVTRAQTIGKVLCGLRIVRSDGSKPDAWRLLGLRYGIGGLLNMHVIVGSLYGLIDALLIFRESRKCLHATIADTKVIKL